MEKNDLATRQARVNEMFEEAENLMTEIAKMREALPIETQESKIRELNGKIFKIHNRILGHYHQALT